MLEPPPTETNLSWTTARSVNSRQGLPISNAGVFLLRDHCDKSIQVERKEQQQEEGSCKILLAVGVQQLQASGWRLVARGLPVMQ
jgi:hypothetical protein